MEKMEQTLNVKAKFGDDLDYHKLLLPSVNEVVSLISDFVFVRIAKQGHITRSEIYEEVEDALSKLEMIYTADTNTDEDDDKPF